MAKTWLLPAKGEERSVCITDVRAVPGDSAFLIDDGKTAVLYDTGFGFTASAVEQNIRAVLGDRPLDYILLTHSHYDHVLGVPYLLECYPTVKVVAGTYAAQVFARASAKAAMCRLNEKSARQLDIPADDPMEDRLRVDIPVSDGDSLLCGSMVFTVVALPGHTKCSVGYYLARQKLLLSTETLGVYFGKDTYLPSFLVGYRLTLEAFQKVRMLAVDRLLLPHYGLVEQERAQIFLQRAELAARQTAQIIMDLYGRGKTKQEIFAFLEEKDYGDHVRPVYPPEAYRVNTKLMIDLVITELSAMEQRRDCGL
ncbi:MAG: MBL fold metallo-hydrolase [Oscillospiraceae bacterium]|nr:MBL fold metallo-hydrolase [Oscillospiraceae bacterium]